MYRSNADIGYEKWDFRDVVVTDRTLEHKHPTPARPLLLHEVSYGRVIGSAYYQFPVTER
jgi:hypothetical protein